MKVQMTCSAAVISHIVSLHCWKEFLGGDLLQLRIVSFHGVPLL